MTDTDNLLITGTPGTGKSTLAKQLAEQLNLKHLDVSALVKENELHSGYNKKWDSYDVDDDMLLDFLEEELKNGGCIVDTHSTDSFPLRWFKHVVCLTAGTDVIFDRLSARGYKPHKITENIECEIMGVCLEEGKEFGEVLTLKSETIEDVARNIEAVRQLVGL
jgi:adenylate kinase